MSASNYDGKGDAGFVADRLAELKAPTTPSASETTALADYAETREHVETAGDPETVDIEIGDETVPCEPLGVGERVRPARKAARAEERGDDMAAIEAVLDMIDALVRVSPPEFDRAFWDGQDEGTLRETFRALGQKSAGGNGPQR